MLREEATNWFNELINDSGDMNWTPMDAARHITKFLHSDCDQAKDFRNVLAQIIKSKL